MKKVFALLLLLSFFSTPSLAKAPDKDIIILYTNDVHCGVDANLGYAGFAYCAEEARKQTPYVALVDDGDFAQGETIGAISHGRYIIEIMSSITAGECSRTSRATSNAGSFPATFVICGQASYFSSPTRFSHTVM